MNQKQAYQAHAAQLHRIEAGREACAPQQEWHAELLRHWIYEIVWMYRHRNNLPSLAEAEKELAA